MSLADDAEIVEVYRDRYARKSILANGDVSIPCPCAGIEVRGKKDLETFTTLRLSYPTERLGFCIVSSANVEDTFIDLTKNLEEEKYRFAPTAKGKQLKMFQEQTFLAVEPATEYTYYYENGTYKKILASLETPHFIRDVIGTIMTELRKYDNGKAQGFQDWKKEFVEEKWRKLNDASLNRLVNENFDSQAGCRANIQIPPTPPLFQPSLLDVTINIIKTATKKAPTNTAAYFNMPLSILRDDNQRQTILKYCKTLANRVVILKIHNLDNILDPDKEDEREAFSEIQYNMCKLRKNGKFTILLEGGKLTFPSLVRGFDIVTNDISGRTKQGGFSNKKKQPEEFIGRSRYYIKNKQIFYPFRKMIPFAENNLRMTNGEHGLKCRLPCCKDIKSVKDLTRDIWNYYVVRPHFCLTMNDMAKEISRLINDDNIQEAKNILLLSELCVLKRLIPDM
ncbi:MAG: hypothetical protein OXL96_00525 [Candidatus Poribacteria bacterium]|nr:hypothetical protein [Candidatus Poribacteria bacterium]